ncbi:hypothetical protein [Microbacterium sp. NIBRBAC000506063]|uniref:hypothetical protein n=1 Tax=Microbacterium sp. NIBRBAC000506063 TaxID=2734618 RepID=UPI001BB5636F|nr:hypothetical protein [Microbacterium sp. NIBRBAC000506063]QTV79927.1 hypothetical protein KAE78_01715 [Microbacterium sp. NIBRBAC000506063]
MAGYLWGLLSEHGLALWGLVAFLVATVVLILGLRQQAAVARVTSIVVLVGLLAGSIAAALLLG